MFFLLLRRLSDNRFPAGSYMAALLPNFLAYNNVLGTEVFCLLLLLIYLLRLSLSFVAENPLLGVSSGRQPGQPFSWPIRWWRRCISGCAKKSLNKAQSCWQPCCCSLRRWWRPGRTQLPQIWPADPFPTTRDTCCASTTTIGILRGGGWSCRKCPPRRAQARSRRS